MIDISDSFVVEVYNETALGNDAVATGIRLAREHLAGILYERKLGCMFTQLPKEGEITRKLMEKRKKKVKLACLVRDASRGIEVARLFGLKISEKSRDKILGSSVRGMAGLYENAIFIWELADETAFGVKKKHPDSFNSRLRGSLLHELGHSFGFLHEVITGTETKRNDGMDLMIPEPLLTNPNIYFVTTERPRLAEHVESFLNVDQGGFFSEL